MNKVITINLGGVAYQLEEQGYDALRAYLETATVRLVGNPDREEILSDIERAIGEKFRALLASYKTVIETKEVTAVLAEMGPIEGESGERAKPDASAPGAQGGPTVDEPASAHGLPKRLYRIREGKRVAGVCNGIAAYFNIDPTFVRLAFVLVTFLWGAGMWAYLVMMIVIPEARSVDEKAAATGFPATAQEYIRRAKEGYYEAMKGFPDLEARRKIYRGWANFPWQRRFRQEMRANRNQWRSHWRSPWERFQPMTPALGFGLPLLSILHGVITLLWICAIVSLLATGTIGGLILPANVPVWLAALLLLFVYGILVGPLKLARRACYRGSGRPGWSWSIVFMFDAVVWIAVVFALVWLAVHFSPELRQAVQSIPSLFHEAKHDVRAWWQEQR